MKWKIYYQVPDVRDQVCECRKEAVNARGNLSRQNREEKCIKARREVLREKIKIKKHLWEYEIMVSITEGWNQNHSYF